MRDAAVPSCGALEQGDGETAVQDPLTVQAILTHPGPHRRPRAALPRPRRPHGTRSSVLLSRLPLTPDGGAPRPRYGTAPTGTPHEKVEAPTAPDFKAGPEITWQVKGGAESGRSTGSGPPGSW